jgi:hypothetical protein
MGDGMEGIGSSLGIGATSILGGGAALNCARAFDASTLPRSSRRNRSVRM